MMEANTPQLILCQNPEAIRKRENRNVLRERRRKHTFVNRYLEINHPTIYDEILNKYESLAEKYPGRADLTKTYLFKKWETQVKNTVRQQKQQRHLYVPHLPILTNFPNVTSQRVEVIEESPRTPAQESPRTPPQESPRTPPQEPPQAPPQESPRTPPQEPPQAPPQEPPQTPPQEPPQTPPQEPLQTPPQEPQEAPQIPPQEAERYENYSGMSLDEMEIAAEEIVRALQSDRELMDIVEGFDLPQSVWDNELSIPDYVLDDELEW